MSQPKVLTLIERLSNVLRHDTRQAGRDLGLQPVQWDVLSYLSQCNRYSDTPQAVTEYLGSTKGTVSQTIKVLEQKGLLTKKSDKIDKRIVHLKLTAKAGRVLDKELSSLGMVLAYEQLSGEQQDELEQCLTGFLRRIQHVNGLKSFSVCYSCRYHLSSQDGRFECGLTHESLKHDDRFKICREHEYIEGESNQKGGDCK